MRVHNLKGLPPPPDRAPVLLNRDMTPAQRAKIRQRLAQLGRPHPGTSEALSRPLSVETIAAGSRDVDVHDLLGMMPLALRRGSRDLRKGGES